MKQEILPLILAQLDPHSVYLHNPWTRTPVKYGNLGAVKLHKGVVYLAAVESRHEVLDGHDALATSADGCTPRGVRNTRGNCRLGDDIEAIRAPEGDAKVRWGRTDGDGDSTTRVEPHARHSKFLLYGRLLHGMEIKR